jgi:hypothetical protein
MRNRKVGMLRVCAHDALFALAAFATTGAATAQVVAPDYAASPDVYKVRAQNDQHRVVEGIWKPGQRDQFHSHPAMGYYWVTDCSARIHLPEGGYRDLTISAGTSGVQAPVVSHAVENVGKAECRIVMFELK